MAASGKSLTSPVRPSPSLSTAPWPRASAWGALRRARQALTERYGEESVVWASYVLYGDPTCRYLETTEEEL